MENQGGSEESLREIMEALPKAEMRVLPSARQLKESGVREYRHIAFGISELIVYENGLFLYTDGRRSTVQRVHRCAKEVEYRFNDGQETKLSCEYFMELPYYLRLVLEGEIRLERNQRMRDRKWLDGSAVQGIEEICNKEERDVLEQITERERIRGIRGQLEALASGEMEILRMRYEEGATQAVIAERCGKSRSTIEYRISRILWEIREGMKGEGEQLK